MHLYTNTCFSGFYLSCYQRHWRTSLFLLHWEPVFPSGISFNITSRSYYTLLPTSKKNSEQDQALDCLFTWAISFTFGIHSITLNHHLPQMSSLSHRDSIQHCLRSLWASDLRLSTTQAWMRPTYVQLVQETKRCQLYVWIWSTCKHLQPYLQVSLWWLPGLPPSAMAAHGLDSINIKS